LCVKFMESGNALSVISHDSMNVSNQEQRSKQFKCFMKCPRMLPRGSNMGDISIQLEFRFFSCE